VLDFQCGPTLKGLVGQFEKVQEDFGGVQLKLCYEASYVVSRCSAIERVEAITMGWRPHRVFRDEWGNW